MNNPISGAGMTSQRTRERLIQRLRSAGIRNEQVLNVMCQMPRHLFVDEALASRAYEDTALPIGFGQTISQPFIVARMTEALLQGGPLKNVLEVGTGSGYQTAVLSRLVDRVYSVERIAPLIERARQRLRTLKIRNVHLKHSDGLCGLPEYAPFDGILAAAAPEELPKALLEQLAIGGRLLIPAGRQGNTQVLYRITRSKAGFQQEELEQVSFVPMVSGIPV
ncbi:MAG: protein-L-isoaspartate(D-aspartate) O-methyltransferase [gamma proteobacterium symbiont of Bathyaustriella thionipta]|nr:protein-L-isoaspartate(D-aspartate) O-methyltransferase [gamma proteobacterium symbiont of Bathyaustriella thionipta]